MAQDFVAIQESDILTDERIKTYGYFSGDAGSFTGTGFVTASDSAGNKEYYYTLQNSAGVDQISVAYGHFDGSGSIDAATSGNPGQSEAVYKQIANRVLDVDESKIGFTFTASKHATSALRKKDIYVIAAHRSRMRDELDKRYWTIQLSGSLTTGVGRTLHLTDNSAYSAGEPTMAGTRYDVISGSQGVKTAATTVFGHYYPKSGLIILNATQVSASIPGTHAAKLSGGNDHWENKAKAGNKPGYGLAPNLGVTGNENNALRLAAGLYRGTQTLRAKEKFLQQNYLCRAGAPNFNYTNNTSYTSGVVFP